jgi:tRNA threonylcarbamoyladenosine biosynthesis protein TsaE
MKSFATHAQQETTDLGRKIGALLKPGDVVAICGNLGTGKTSLVIGICEVLHVRTHVASPTFTIINEYTAPWGKVAHIDLYRIRSRKELADLGIEEYFNERSICLIEWADEILDLLPPDHYVVRIAYGTGDDERAITVEEMRAARSTQGRVSVCRGGDDPQRTRS